MGIVHRGLGIALAAIATATFTTTAPAATDVQPQPWASLSPIKGDFNFATAAPAVAAPEPRMQTPPVIDAAERAWVATQNTTSIAVLEDFIRQFGATPFGGMARTRLHELKKSQSRPRR
jgi:hypothetical protein